MVTVSAVGLLLVGGGSPAEALVVLFIWGLFGSIVGALIGTLCGAAAGCLLAITGKQHHARLVGAAFGLLVGVGIAGVTLSEGPTVLGVIGASLAVLLVPAIGYGGGAFFLNARTSAGPRPGLAAR